MKIQTSAVEKQPGEKVDLTISTKPLSNVCLLGVDQSVVLLKSGELREYYKKNELVNIESTVTKSGNDIVPSDVYAELGTYNNYVVSPLPISPIRPIGPIRPIIGLQRAKRAIFPPWRRGGWVDFDVSVFLQNLNIC